MSIVNLSGRARLDPVADEALAEGRPSASVAARSIDLVDLSEPAGGEITNALIQMDNLGFDLADSAAVERAILAGRREHADRVHGEHLRTLRRETIREKRVHAPVVYYMRVGNRVKIGYTTNLTQRLSTIAPEEVLATEPGGRQLEGHRHDQFADLHVAREWFRLESPLTDHISGLAVGAA